MRLLIGLKMQTKHLPCGLWFMPCQIGHACHFVWEKRLHSNAPPPHVDKIIKGVSLAASHQLISNPLEQLSRSQANLRKPATNLLPGFIYALISSANMMNRRNPNLNQLVNNVVEIDNIHNPDFQGVYLSWNIV